MKMSSRTGAPKSSVKKPPPPPKPKLAQDFAKAVFNYSSVEPEELSFIEGDVLFIIDKSSDPEWWKARLNGREGFVPSNYVQLLASDDASRPSLHDACRRGNLQLVEECLKNRLPVNTQDKADNTALHYACHSGNIQALRLLLDGVDPRVLKLNTPNRMGDTPLHLASARGHANVIQALRDHEYSHTGVRVDIDARNKSGETAFDRAKDAWVKAELIKWHDSRDTASLQMARRISDAYANSEDDE